MPASGLGQTIDQNGRIAAFNARLMREQNLPAAIAAGLVTALAGAGLWAVITVATGLQLGLVALALGAAIGYAVRFAGKGLTKIYGVVGGGFTLLACVLGEFFTGVQQAATYRGSDFLSVLTSIDVPKAFEATIESTSPLSFIIYAIGIYEGYQFSFRRVTAQEIKEAGVVVTPPPPAGS